MGQGHTAASVTGINGWTHLTGAVTTYTPPAGVASFMAIQATNGASAVIDQSETTADGVENWSTDLTIASGQIIYGVFTGIRLVSGEAIAYHR